MGLKRALLGLLLVGLFTGCHHKPKHEDADAVRTYDPPAGPNSGLVKIIDTDAKDDVWWYWFEFVDSNHLIKEYRVCNSNDFIPKGMAGNISMQWQSTDDCFKIISFNRREDLEDDK